MAWSSVQLPTGARVRLLVLAAVVTIVAVLAARNGEHSAGDDGQHASAVAPTHAPDEHPDEHSDEHPDDTGTAAPNNERALPPSCDALALDAADGGAEAAAFGWLCPDAPMGPMTARAFVGSIDNPIDAARAAVRLHGHPQLVALARFVAEQRIELPSATPADTAAALPRPEKASVSPINDDILRHTQRARAVI
ncbi:MAG: hypothetical protein JKY37_32125, partial [Nannocystaceae bacterium]|nr:hypothetical protein [Nannocystaceae bacterium]